MTELAMIANVIPPTLAGRCNLLHTPGNLMTATAQRKEADPSIPADASWVSLNKAASLLGESRDKVAKRALLGEIRTTGIAHVLLFLEVDVRRVAAEKASRTASEE